eukprot:12430992-Karenia_brevis.AAC.1
MSSLSQTRHDVLPKIVTLHAGWIDKQWKQNLSVRNTPGYLAATSRIERAIRPGTGEDASSRSNLLVRSLFSDRILSSLSRKLPRASFLTVANP